MTGLLDAVLEGLRRWAAAACGEVSVGAPGGVRSALDGLFNGLTGGRKPP